MRFRIYAFTVSVFIVFVWTEGLNAKKVCVYYRLRLQSSSCGHGLRVASLKFSCNPSHLQNFGFRLNVDGLQRPVLASTSDESLEELEELKEHLNRSPVH